MSFHHMSQSQGHPLHQFFDHHQQLQETTAPNWLNTVLLRSQQPQHHHAQFSDTNFLNLHTTTHSPASSQAPNQWLSRSSSSLLHRNNSDSIEHTAAAAGDSIVVSAAESADLEKKLAKCEIQGGDIGASFVRTAIKRTRGVSSHRHAG